MIDPLQKNFTDRINFIIQMLENIRENCGVLDADDLTDQYMTFAGIAEDISRIKSHIYWTAYAAQKSKQLWTERRRVVAENY